MPSSISQYLFRIGLALTILCSMPRSEAADFPPTDHGGADLTLAHGDRIWGSHSNIQTLTIPEGVTVTVRPLSRLRDHTGFVEIHAQSIFIDGTLQATAAGHPGGGGGGGGAGSARQGVLFEFTAAPGVPGAGGASAYETCWGMSGWFANANQPGVGGGAGGSGGMGSGLFPGTGGSGGDPETGNSGKNAQPGLDGGYLAPGFNGDHSTDPSATLGSGGGGGGGGAGGGTNFEAVNQGAGGGGGGAAGGAGGGAILLFAEESLSVTGRLLAAGSMGQSGVNGHWGISSPESSAGGHGGAGAHAIDSGIGTGGLPGGGTRYTGGRGGNGGRGAGGGIVLSCNTPWVDLTGAILDVRGGDNTYANTGTVKLFVPGSQMPSGATVLSTRLYVASPDTTPPHYQAAPGVISAELVAGTPNQVRLTWQQAVDDLTPPERIRYEIYASVHSGSVFSGTPIQLVTGQTQTVLTGLPITGEPSWLAVRARDAAGNRELNQIVVLGPSLTAVRKRVWVVYR